MNKTDFPKIRFFILSILLFCSVGIINAQENVRMQKGIAQDAVSQIESVQSQKVLPSENIPISTNWSSAPFDFKIFVENKGQFNKSTNKSSDKILFEAKFGEIKAYFTRNGIVYRYQKNSLGNEKEREERERERAKAGMEQEREELDIKFVRLNWVDCNENVEVETRDEQSYYYTYPMGMDKTIEVKVYKKIIYKNLYPGIDVEYIFPENKEGLKYNVIIHPGANASLVKLKYQGTNQITKNNDGDAIVKTVMNDFTDHAPVCYYEGGETIDAHYKINGNEESFVFDKPYDLTRTVIIDPWTTNPAYTGAYNQAYDIDYDDAGNVFAYGSWSPSQLVKFNSAGVIQWKFNATTINTDPDAQWGDFAVDKVTGRSYLAEGFNPSSAGGARALKVSSAGALVATFAGNPNLEEMDRVAYNICNHQLVIAGGGPTKTNQACMIDTSMTGFAPKNVLGANLPYHDMWLLAMDPDGNTCYMGSVNSSANVNAAYDDRLLRLNVPTLTASTFNFNINTTFGTYMPEGLSDLLYMPWSGAPANGFNGLACSKNFLFFYDGADMYKLNKTSGGLIAKRPNVSTTMQSWGGLDVDVCDNVFVGSDKKVFVYNGNTLAAGSAPTATISCSNTVYDVMLSKDYSMVYVGGEGFVSSFASPVSPITFTNVITGPTCGSCNGSITANLYECGTVKTGAYLWSDGQTTQTAAGLCTGTYTVTVTPTGECRSYTNVITLSAAGALTPTIAAAPSTLCNGGSTTLTASGATTYTWSANAGSVTTNTVSISPASTTVYTVTGTTGGCTGTQTISITVSTTPTVTISGTSSICSGTSVVLTGATASNYTWSTSATTNTISVSPTSNTTYTLTGANGVCTATAAITITVTPTPTLTVNSASICSGASVVLTAASATSYSWSTTETTNTISVNPVSTTIYTVTGDNGNGCTVTKTATVTVNTTPTVSITGAAPICSGTTLILTGGTATNYTWLPGGQNTNTISITPPNGTNSYTLVGANGTCTATTTALVDVSPSPTITVNNASICSGQSAVLTGNGAATYTWSANAGSVNTNTVSISPGSTTVYTITGTTASCTNIATATVTVNTTPTLSLPSSTYTVCSGSGTSISTSGATTYTWSPAGSLSSTNGGTVTATPGSTTIYTVSGSNGSCISTPATVTVTVNTLPTLTLSPTSTALCSSTSSTLTASGATNYTWSPSGSLSSANGATVTATPNTTTDYTVTGTDANGCTNTNNVTIVVSPTPTISINALPPTACVGQSVILTGGTATTYTWSANAGSVNTNTVSVTPATATTYTLTGTIGSCTASAVATINVNPVPIIGASTVTAAPCGLSTGCIDSVFVSGGTPNYQYSWNNGATWSNSSQHCNIPAGSYTLEVKDQNGCSDTTSISVVNQNAPAAPTVAVSSNSVCVGANVSLNINPVQSGITYTWTDNTGTHTGTNYTVTNISPAGNYTISVTATDQITGCISVATNTLITVNALPTITATATLPTICSGQSTVLTASGATTYTWSANAGSVTTNTALVNPSTNTTYTVTGDNGGCTNTQTVTVAVNTTPTVTANSTQGTICSGQSTTLTASGASNFTWTPGGATTNTISVSPNATTTYVVTGDNGGCTNTQTVTVIVTTNPTVTAVASQTTICTNQTATLTASGASNYTWAPGGTGSIITVSPTNNTTYTITGVNGNCSSIYTISVNVNPSPTVNIAPSATTICSGQTATLTASGATNYTWLPSGATTGSITDNPTSNTTYTLVGDSAGCFATQTFFLNVNLTPANPLISVPTYTYCQGQTLSQIAASGNPIILWSANSTMNPVINTGSTYTPIGLPVGTTIYYLQDSSAAGCKSVGTTSVTVTIYPTPTVSGGNLDTAKCGLFNGGVNGINVIGGTPVILYQWYNGTTPIANATSPTLTGAGAGTYSVLITDANGCVATGGTTIFTIPSIAQPNASITPPVSQGQAPLNVTFTNNTSGATFYAWNFGNGISFNLQNPSPVTYNAPGTYTVILIASNSACTDRDTAIVIIDSPVNIIIPNIYSPNGDGINDEFFISCVGIRDLHCDIFNRWGTLVYQLLAVDQKWDGVMNNGNTATEGTYYYILEATGYDRKIYKSHGPLTLVR